MAWGFASKWRCAYQAVALWLVGILIGSALTARCLPLPAKRTIRNSLEFSAWWLGNGNIRFD